MRLPHGEHRKSRADSRGSADHRATRAQGEGQTVYGVEPVRELVAAAPETIRVLYVRAGDERRFAPEIERVRSSGGRVEIVQVQDLDRLSGPQARHQGLVALIREYRFASFEEMLREKPDPLVLVDGVTDPRNLGALLRSAEGAGVRAIVLARDRTVSITPAVVKASAGAWIHLQVARCGNVARALEDLKEAGYWIAALAPGGNVSLYDLDASRRIALVMGSEGRGVREIVKKAADFVVEIPMRGKIASLNVSVAAAVALFEIARRRSAVKAST